MLRWGITTRLAVIPQNISLSGSYTKKTLLRVVIGIDNQIQKGIMLLQACNI